MAGHLGIDWGRENAAVSNYCALLMRLRTDNRVALFRGRWDKGQHWRQQPRCETCNEQFHIYGTRSRISGTTLWFVGICDKAKRSCIAERGIPPLPSRLCGQFIPSLIQVRSRSIMESTKSHPGQGFDMAPNSEILTSRDAYHKESKSCAAI